ncbi:MAG: DUF6505 family protein [Stappiaceae bacterium]
MKFLKTIHFDPSDTRVFPLAAGSDEWAVSGGFSFSTFEEDELKGKWKQAFSNGFFSIESFGHATFTQVVSLEEAQVADLQSMLAQHFVDRFGAPSVADALPVAAAEIDFIVKLCTEVPINSVFTLRRFFDDTGEIREEFRIIDTPGEKPHARVWDVIEDE